LLHVISDKEKAGKNFFAFLGPAYLVAIGYMDRQIGQQMTAGGSQLAIN
jgi:Mn2+/Fe2+ NRAMP family transporter